GTMRAATRLTIIPPPERAVPGGQAVLSRVKVVNTGNLVDEVAITVRDLPEEWVTIAQPAVVLVPGDEAEVAIAIRVPRSSSAAAGTHEFAVVATSNATGREVL